MRDPQPPPIARFTTNCRDFDCGASPPVPSTSESERPHRSELVDMSLVFVQFHESVGDRLMAGQRTLDPLMKVRVLLPELLANSLVLRLDSPSSKPPAG